MHIYTGHTLANQDPQRSTITVKRPLSAQQLLVVAQCQDQARGQQDADRSLAAVGAIADPKARDHALDEVVDAFDRQVADGKVSRAYARGWQQSYDDWCIERYSHEEGK